MVHPQFYCCSCFWVLPLVSKAKRKLMFTTSCHSPILDDQPYFVIIQYWKNEIIARSGRGRNVFAQMSVKQSEISNRIILIKPSVKRTKEGVYTEAAFTLPEQKVWSGLTPSLLDFTQETNQTTSWHTSDLNNTIKDTIMMRTSISRGTVLRLVHL